MVRKDILGIIYKMEGFLHLMLIPFILYMKLDKKILINLLLLKKDQQLPINVKIIEKYSKKIKCILNRLDF
jgi:hypothetical protein